MSQSISPDRTQGSGRIVPGQPDCRSAEVRLEKMRRDLAEHEQAGVVEVFSFNKASSRQVVGCADPALVILSGREQGGGRLCTLVGSLIIDIGLGRDEKDSLRF